MPRYDPPVSNLLLGLLAILVLALAGYALPSAKQDWPAPPRLAPPPWVVGIGAPALAFPWWLLIALAFAPYPPLPLWLALLAGCSWAATAFFVIRRWTRGHGWSDRQRWALAFGALVACMMAGFLGSSLWPTIDLVGKAALNTIAIALMVILARSVWRRNVPA